jgi:hypothetical protein
MTEKAVPGSVLEVIEINALPFRGRVRLQLDAVMGRAPSERVKVAVPRYDETGYEVESARGRSGWRALGSKPSIAV